MNRIGLGLAAALLAVSACAPAGRAPEGILALPPVPPADPPVQVAAAEPPPADLADEAVAPPLSDELPLPARVLPADLSPAEVDAVLAELRGDQVDQLPAPTGKLGMVELGPADDGLTGPAGAFRVLAAPALEPRGLGAAAPSTLAAVARAHPEVLAGLTVLGARDLPRFALQALPKRIDIRQFMPGVRDQQARGTCVFFATAGVVDYLHIRSPVRAIRQASPQQMYWLYHAYTVAQIWRDELWQDAGCVPMFLYDQLRPDGSSWFPVSPPRTGFVGESDCRYQGGLGGDPAGADPEAMALKHLQKPLYDRLKAGRAVYSQSVDMLAVANDATTIKTALAAGRPVTVGMPVSYADWSPRAPHWRIGEYNPNKPLDGYHDVVIVGYEVDAAAPGGGWYLIRNSWGPRWGDRGHARLSFKSVASWGDVLYTPGRAVPAVETRFELRASAKDPTPRPFVWPSPGRVAAPSPSPTPARTPTPAPRPSAEAVAWDQAAFGLAIRVEGGEPWLAYEHRELDVLREPQFGWAALAAGADAPAITGWVDLAGTDIHAHDGKLRLPFFMTQADGRRYALQVRGKDDQGRYHYSARLEIQGGGFR